MNATHDRAKSIFLTAAEIASADERRAFLDTECAGDISLRSEVDELLLHQQGLGSFLESPAIASETDTRHLTPDTLAERPGTVIGPYKLLQQIGEGGMGVVFMAEQTEPIQRTVALKIIKPGMDTRQVIARFEAERQALAMMDHPNIARVLDAGTTGESSGSRETSETGTLTSSATGRPYFVMELVKGVPITKYCDEKKLSLRERLELFKPVCEAVQHAHQKGIIHRDIKPTNVLVAEYDNRAVPKVIDFGVAKATAQKLTERTMFTEFGQVIGTVEYMSPEQAKFNQLDIDTRSDIYSLGVLLYELLTGSTPFDRERLREAAFDEVLRIIREEEPPKPSTRLSFLSSRERAIDSLPLAGRVGEGMPSSLASIAANRHTEPARLSKEVNGELDWIVMKCLEKDRSRRYETANGFAMDLQRYLQDEAVQACPPSAAYRFRKFIRRNKAVVLAGTAVATALFLGLILASVGLIQARRQAARADREARKAETEATHNHQVAVFLEEMLQSVGPSVALGRDTTMLREVLDRTTDRLLVLKDQPTVESDLRATLGKVYLDLGEFAKAEATHRKALELRQAALGSEHLDIADSLEGLAEALRKQNKFEEAEPLSLQALAMRRRLLGDAHVDVAQSLVQLGLLYRQEYKEIVSEKYFRDALAIQRNLLSNDDPRIAMTLQQLGLTLAGARKLKEAEAVNREALALNRMKASADPTLAHSLHNLALVLRSERKFDEAEPLFREALKLRRQLLGPAHPDLTDTLIVFAESLREQGKLAEAEQLSREGLAMQKKLFGESSNKIINHLFILGRIVEDQGKLDEAEQLYRDALAVNGSNDRFPTPKLIRSALNRVIDKQAQSRKSRDLKSSDTNKTKAPHASDTNP